MDQKQMLQIVGKPCPRKDAGCMLARAGRSRAAACEERADVAACRGMHAVGGVLGSPPRRIG